MFATPVEVGRVLDGNGEPRYSPRSPSGFDLSGYALDAWAKARTSGGPCEVVLIGMITGEDGYRHYIDAINPRWLETQGYVIRDGRPVSVCPECEREGGRHLRSCSMG